MNGQYNFYLITIYSINASLDSHTIKFISLIFIADEKKAIIYSLMRYLIYFIFLIKLS